MSSGRSVALLAAMLAASCVEVGEPPPELGSAEQAVSVCADGPTLYGIDVSRFQGAIDWDLVKGSGVVYAYIQISRSLTDIDVRFPYNWRRAREVGILRGAYQRFQPDQDVLGQARLFLEKLGPLQPGDLPPMLDVEDDGGLPPAVIAQNVKQWMDHVEAALGVKPLIYTGYYFWRDQVGPGDFGDHPLWIANYSAMCPLVPAPWNRWAFHQYSASAQIPGITVNTVDVNRFNGTLADLKALSAPLAPCPIITSEADGVIIDDSSPCFEAGGDPRFIRTAYAGHGSSLKWTHATDAASASSFGLWHLDFAASGRYRVEAFTPAPYNQSRSATYRITHGGTTTDVLVDQSAVDGWNLVGELEFAAGDPAQSIRVDDNTGEAGATQTKIVYDALRFTRVDEPEVPDGEMELGPTDSGCAAGGGGGWLLALLMLVATRGGRRAAARSDGERRPSPSRAP